MNYSCFLFNQYLPEYPGLQILMIIIPLAIGFMGDLTHSVVLCAKFAQKDLDRAGILLPFITLNIWGYHLFYEAHFSRFSKANGHGIAHLLSLI